MMWNSCIVFLGWFSSFGLIAYVICVEENNEKGNVVLVLKPNRLVVLSLP